MVQSTTNGVWGRQRPHINNTMKGLWVDDIRKLPTDYTGWDVARSYREAVELLSSNTYDVVSLDHDIASYEDGKERTGYDLVKWIVQRKFDGHPVPKEYRIHSANPVGRQNMQQTIDRYLREQQEYTAKDAAALKALAELGFVRDELTPEQEEQLQSAIDELNFKETFK